MLNSFMMPCAYGSPNAIFGNVLPPIKGNRVVAHMVMAEAIAGPLALAKLAAAGVTFLFNDLLRKLPLFGAWQGVYHWPINSL